ncbi:HNH endonuclease [Undibacterium sp. TC4M20W]|uniref:HNH endonuclease n=1 Tax=Undibacterium sp. TC4M20W TaxID=3413052 RepID=UPI003BF193AF
MICSHGRIAPTPITKLRLFADSGGYCANPNCSEPIFKEFDDEVIHIAEIAHIISAGDKGPRADAKLTDEERSRYENLLLLCPNCHTTIDKAEDKFSEGLILEWKRRHKEKLAVLFGIKLFPSRKEARYAIVPLLLGNRAIFDKYGPNTDERFNPESSVPTQWRRKIRESIIPNNRKILDILDANRTLLREEEFLIIETFREHVNDFEAKHLGGALHSGERFPEQLNKIFE